MKKYPFLSLLLTLSILLSLLVLPASALEDPGLVCDHAILMDATYDEILYSKGGYERSYPASMTKVMTALLVLEAVESGRLSLDTVVTVNGTAVQDIPVSYIIAGFKAGETISIEELLYCLLLPSYGDAANVLAEAVDGSIEDFVAHMNRKAGELGCKDTHFTNTYGRHNDEHYTTAYDVALWMKAALEYDLFRTIIKTDRHKVPATNLAGEREFFNLNALISNMYRRGYVYDKCIGGKTGSTDEAGLCLVAAAEDKETRLISVVMGSREVVLENGDKKQGQFLDSAALLKWGFDNFQRVTITKGSQPVDKVVVTMSRQADEVNVKPEGSITRTLPKDLDLNLIESEIYLFSKEVEAPVKEGDVLGSMKLSYNGELYGILDLVAVTSVERSELLYKKAQFLDFVQTSGLQIALAVLLLSAAFLLLRLVVFRKKRRYRAGAGASRRGNYRGTRL